MLRKFVLLCCLLGLASVTQASHFRYYHARWNANGLAVDFTIAQAWRMTFFCRDGSGNCDAALCTNSVSNTGSQSWGDGSSTAVDLTFTSVCCADDWGEGQFIHTHTYAAAGTYDLLFSSCCRIGNLLNSANNGYTMRSTITVAAGVNIPSASIGLLPIEQISSTQPYVRDLTSLSAIPAGASNVVYSTNHADCGASVPIPGIMVTSGGVLSWDPSAHPAGLYTTCVHISYDLHGSQKVVVDWIYQTAPTNAGNTPPTWDDANSEADGSIISVSVGDPVSFTMTAVDVDPDTVMIIVAGLPAGVTVTNTDGNPAVFTFSWTPGPMDTGFVILSFGGNDGRGGFLPARSVTIEVDVIGGGDDCPDSQDVALGSAAASVSSAGDCVEMCFA